MCEKALSEAEREALFGRWLECHQGLIYKVARSFVRKDEDCDDLVQEILLQLWRSARRFGGAAKESTWIYRVSLNTALAWSRGEKRWMPGRAPMDDMAEVPDFAASGRREREDQLARLYAAIRRLSKVDAAMILLSLDDVSYREMSEILGISETHVGVKLHRARKALTQLYHEDTHE